MRVENARNVARLGFARALSVGVTHAFTCAAARDFARCCEARIAAGLREADTQQAAARAAASECQYWETLHRGFERRVLRFARASSCHD
jgi:hypothetical protein